MNMTMNTEHTEHRSFFTGLINKFGYLCVFILALALLSSCASRQRSLTSEADVQNLDSFEDFEDAFTRAAERSVVGSYAAAGDANLIVYFDFDSAYLALDGRASLDIEIEKIKELGEAGSTIIRVLGHTDERGSDSYNLALGQRRADSVASYMATKGVPPNIIQSISYGEQHPISRGSSERAWSENRRVEIIY